MLTEHRKRFSICLFAALLACATLAAAEGAPGVPAGELRGTSRNRPSGTLSFDFLNVPLDEALAYIAEEGDLAIALEEGIDRPVTLRLVDVLPEEALSIVGKQVGARVKREGERAYRVSPVPLMSVSYTNASLPLVLSQLSKQSGTNVIVSPKVTGNVNVQLRNVPWQQALEVIVRSAGYELVEEDSGIVRVVTTEDLRDQVATRVFELHYVQPPDIYRPLIKSEFAVGGPEEQATTGAYSGAGAPAGQRATVRSGGGTGGSSSRGASFTLLNSVANALSGVGRVEYEPSSNSLIVTDIKPRLEEIARIISMVDTPPPQVFVDMKFVTTNLTDFSNVGVDWANGWTVTAQGSSVATRLPFTVGRGGFEDALSIIDDGPPKTVFDPATGAVTPAVPPIPSTGGYVFGRIDFTSMSAMLSLLKRDESTTILQAPRIVTIDNEEATVFVGETVRFAETFSASSQGGGIQRGIREAANSPVDTGFQLFITPHVVRGTDEVVLTLIPEDNSLVGRAGQNIAGFETFTSGEESIDLPQVASRTLVTKVIVRHGETLVLGGLIQQTESESQDKIPFFGDLPLLGWLFKNKSVSKDQRNLMIFLTVLIERTPDDSNAVYLAHRRHEAAHLSPIQRLSPPEESLPAGVATSRPAGAGTSQGVEPPVE
ncbi:MAG: secretin N-terminal domain-containing protein [Planctomycetota bacterium]